MNYPPNAYAGDSFLEPVSGKMFYFTGERWIDVTGYTCEEYEKLEKTGQLKE